MLLGLMTRPVPSYRLQAGLSLQTVVSNVFGATVKHTSIRRDRGIVCSVNDRGVAIRSSDMMFFS
jgi:hypothetical protein